MEIADVFVVNKADRPGADRLLKEISQAIHLRAGDAMRNVPAHHGVDMAAAARARKARDRGGARGDTSEGWTIPVLKTVAQTGDGVPELLDAVERHRAHLVASGELERRRRARAERRVRDVVDRELRRVAWRSPAVADRLAAGLDRIVAGQETPYSVAAGILDELLAAPAPATASRPPEPR
jgi:LAO/AO transport system kinase